MLCPNRTYRKEEEEEYASLCVVSGPDPAIRICVLSNFNSLRVLGEQLKADHDWTSAGCT